MEENQVVVLDEGVSAREVATAAACCKTGTPSAALRAEPEPSA